MSAAAGVPGWTAEVTQQVHEVRLEMFDPQLHVEELKSWLRRPHVVRWWGDPEKALTSSLQRPAGSHAVIVAGDTPVGYLCWQRPSREELEAAGLTDLPEGLVDIDILIGETEFLGRGVGPRALAHV